MKYSFALLTGLFSSLFAIAQKTDDSNDKKAESENVFKINLGSLSVKNFAFQYERAIGKKTSVALGVRFQPYGTIPFKSTIEDAVNDPDIKVGDIKVGNFALTPEFRYYLGKAALKGFYLAPYARYANYKMQAPVTYTSTLTTKTALFTGNISSFSGGLLMGSQFKLGKSVVLDWWILGGHFGSSDGTLDFATPLTTTEQADLRASLDNIDIPLFNIEYNIHANGGTISSKGAWAGFRGFGLNLGIRF